MIDMPSISPLKAIRQKCLNCCCYEKLYVKTCPIVKCSLWKFRLGIHPFTKKNCQNQLLQQENFVGFENKTPQEMMKILKDKFGNKVDGE